MPAELLIRADTGAVPKGAIIAVKPGGWVWGSAETLPSFVQATISDATAREVQGYLGRWVSEPVLSVVGTSGETIRLKVEGSQVAGDGTGQITKGDAQPHIDALNGSFVSDDGTGVAFDVTAFGVITSEAVLGVAVDQVTFTQTGFAGGVHTIEADYSAAGFNPNRVTTHLQTAGAEVVNNDGAVATFRMDQEYARDAVLSAMEKLTKRISRFRYRFAESAVDTAIAAGGSVTVTKQQAQNNITDMAA